MSKLELMSAGEIEIKYKAALRHKQKVFDSAISPKKFDDEILSLTILSKDLGDITLLGFAESIETRQSFAKLALAR